MENIKTLVLEGYLGEIYGERHEGVFEDTRSALLMMARRHNGFLSCIKGDYHVIFRTGEIEVLIGEDELHLPATKVEEIILVPVPDGSNKGKGGVKIIAAIALVALSFIPGVGAVAGLALALQGAGAVLFLGGVTALLSPSPQLGSADQRIENADSYLFNSTSNVDQDGYAEPLALGGPILCGSHVASSGIEVIELMNADVNNSIDPTFPNYGYPQFDNAIGGLKSGKGGGSTARAAREAPTTYQTEAVAKLVEIISSGEIEGFVYPSDPFRNVYLDRTPVQNPDLSFNMRGVEMQNRWGLAEQDHLSGFDEVSNPVSVNVKVSFGTNNTVTRTLANNPSAPLDRVIVTLRWNSMTEQNPENGDLNGSSVSYKIYIIPNGGSAQTVVDTTFAQKFTSPTEKSYSIALPVGGHPYQVRVERTSPDPVSVAVQNDMFFSSYSEIIDAKLTYPMRAVVGLKAYARLFGDSIPERGYLLKGVITEVPTNYDPETRIYTGVWNGTFKMAWTNNPVWILWGLLTNKTWGLGNQIPRTIIDRYSFYGPAVVCDQSVTDGKGGTEPRYTYSKWLRERQSTMPFLQAVASSFRGKLIWGKGGIMLSQDTVKNPVRIVTNANVIDGTFSYSQVAEEDIRNVAYCSYIEPNDGWKETLVVAENATSLASKGRRPRNVIAEGSTSARQALEFGRWVVFSEQYNDEMVSFKGYYDLADILPGNVIMVSDVNEIGYRHGGRLVSCTTTTATMDSAFQFQSGVTYTIHITMPDGTLQSRALNGTGSTNTANVSWSTALPATPLGSLNTVFCITSTQIAPSLWSVESISEEDGEDGVLSFLCVKYTTAKFSVIDSNLAVPEPVTSLYDPSIRPAPVTGITMTRVLVSERAGNIEKIQVRFTASDSVFVKDYKIQYRYKNGVWTESVSPSDNAEIPYQGEGVYEVIVTANDFLNRTSVGVSASQTFTGRARTIATLANLRVTGASPGVTTFAESELRVEWDVVAPSGIVDASYEDPYFRDYVIEVRKGAVLLGTYYTTQRNFRLTEQLNARISGTGIPEPSLNISVRLRDTDGNLSGAISQTFDNPVPSAPTGIIVTPGLSEANIRVPIPTNVPDFTRILIWVYTSTFDQTQAPTFVTTEADIRVPVTQGTTLKARVAYADSFTRANNAWAASAELTLSTRVTTTTEMPIEVNTTITEVIGARRTFSDLLGSVSNAALTASWTSVTSRPLNLNDLDTTAQTDITNTKSEVVAARGTYGTVAARISAEETARINADSVLAGRATTIEAVVRYPLPEALNKNPTFSTWSGTSGTIPEDWSDWANGLTNTKVTGDTSPFAYRQAKGTTGADWGILQSINGVLTQGWHVLEADIRLNSGTLNGSGVYIQYGVSGITDSTSYGFWSEPDVNGTVHGAGTPGRRYRFAKLVQLINTANVAQIFAMTGWNGFGDISSTTRDITWHKCSIRPASDSEIELRAARGAAASVGARITTEETARASADSALATRATTLEAQMANTSSSGLQSRIATEETARASADSTLASQITVLTASVNGNPNLFPYPTPIANRTPSQLGWAGTPITSTFSSGVGGLVYYRARASGGSAMNEGYSFDLPEAMTFSTGQQFTFSCYGYGGTATVGDRLYAFLDFRSADNSTSLYISQTMTLNSGGTRQSAVGTFPGSFTNGRLRVVFIREWPSSGSYQDLVFNMIKVECGPIATAFTNSAQVAQFSSVSVDAYGRAYAISGTQTEVNGRKGGFVMDNNGVLTNFQITADDFRIYQSVGGSNIVPFRVVGGQTQINDALVRTLNVVPDGGGPSHRVQLRPNSVSGADGASFTFSPAYGGIPLIRPVVLQPPALAANETYDISATNLSASGFTIRAKKFTAGTPTAQSSGAGSNVGGTPQWRAHKPTTADADGNSYTYSWTATLDKVSQEFFGGSSWYAEYYGEFDVYYNSGSSWVVAYSVGVAFESFYGTTPPATVTGQAATSTAVLPAIGQHGSQEFGLHPTVGAITAFAGVNYTTTSQSSVVSLPGNFTFDIFAPT